MDSYKKDITSKIIKCDDYKMSEYTDKAGLSLRDQIICFFNGINWVVVKIDVMLSYPILYFSFWSLKYKKYFINSLLVCPITLRTIIYKGKIEIIDIIKNNLKLRNLDTKDEFMMDQPFTGLTDKDGKEKEIKSQIKRYKVMISTLRDLYSIIGDPKYINTQLPINSIIPKRYYEDNKDIDENKIQTSYHPKTLAYIVQYYSFSAQHYKHIVIPPSNLNPKFKAGYEFKKEEFFKFFKEKEEIYKKNNVYIYPILWFQIPKIYDDFNIYKS